MVERRYNKGETNANTYKPMNMTMFAENRVASAHLRYWDWFWYISHHHPFSDVPLLAPSDVQFFITEPGICKIEGYMQVLFIYVQVLYKYRQVVHS